MRKDNTRTKILEWLSPGTRSATHKEKLKERVKNTGEWFLESPKFRDWINGKGPNILFYSGKGISSSSTAN
jgi:hypothetical protein